MVLLRTSGLPSSSPGLLDSPGAVATAPDGRLAVADTGHGRILVARRDGTVTHVVGPFGRPRGVAFATDDVLLVTDAAAGTLERVVLTTDGTHDRAVVSSGLARPRGVVARPDGTCLIAESAEHRLVSVDLSSGAITPVVCTEGRLLRPTGIALLGELPIVVDRGAHTLNLVTGEQALVVLPGSASLAQPTDVCAGADGSALYVADTASSRVRVWRRGDVATLAVAGLAGPTGIAAFPDGHLLVADSNHHRLVEIDPGTGSLEPLALHMETITTGRHGLEGQPLLVLPDGFVTVPFVADLAGLAPDRSNGPVTQVVITAAPAEVLPDGPRHHGVDLLDGSIDLVVDPSVDGELLVDVVVTGLDDGPDGGRAVLVHARTRHPLKPSV